MGRGITEVECSAMEIENRYFAGDLGHEFIIVLSFREIRTRAAMMNIGAITSPLRSYVFDARNCIFLPSSLLLFQALDSSD